MDDYSPYSPFPDQGYMPDGQSTTGYEPFREGVGSGTNGANGASGMRRSLFSSGGSSGEARRGGATSGDCAAAPEFVGSTCVSSRANAMYGARGGMRTLAVQGGGSGPPRNVQGGSAALEGGVAGDASPGMAAGLAVGNGIMERALQEAGQLEARGLMREASEVVARAMERMKKVQEFTSASMRGSPIVATYR